MAEVLSEINKEWLYRPVAKILKKKKEPKMLEEQIRDTYPCDVELEEEKDEKL